MIKSFKNYVASPAMTVVIISNKLYKWEFYYFFYIRIILYIGV